MDLVEEILEFWFGGACDSGVPAERLRLWFGGDAATDTLIRERFSGEVETALDGGFEEWTAHPRGVLALILLLDQFPRNIFRNTPRAYAGDTRALRLAVDGVRAGRERSLPLVRRAFFYMPLEHAEDLEMQNLSVHSFEGLVQAAPAALKEVCEGFLDYARRHREIIRRFGRFPHRNRTLGRHSTAQEAAFLKQPGSSF